MQCVQKVSIFSWKFYFLMVLLDLVWSDPEEVDTWAVSPRGAGWLFGAKVTNEVSCKLSLTLQLRVWIDLLKQ